MVREFLPNAQIAFEKEGGRDESHVWLMDNTRLREEFEVNYPRCASACCRSSTTSAVKRGGHQCSRGFTRCGCCCQFVIPTN